MYLTETEAIKAVEDIAKKHTSDVKVTILRRKPKDLISKYLFLGMNVSPKNSETFFDEYMMATASNESLEIIEGEIVSESNKPKDIFLIRAEVRVVKADS